ncbi:SDR family oxidoreductase [Pararhizobium mangrovi]|uniref:SDR family oxidoreductase n=1 Tax=Pararhizobium mangrovi TaxID=2590452 RepID=A0A506TXE2_9HYPH|nr:SDR family oxidoreductase [Pararhizobium mangrovi]TPW26180.1 SDR family oxidoreductase [Pararhizobium mangrovi]
MPQDPLNRYPRPPFAKQKQSMPGATDQMDPRPDHGEKTYRGNGRLEGCATIVTGADSGIGRAVAIAFAREGADVAISYYSEHEEAKETARLVEEAGRKALVIAGDLKKQEECNALVERTIEEFGKLDVLVNNAAHQASFAKFEDISAEEWDVTFRTNIYSMFYLCQAAVPRMKPGSSIVNSSSVNATDPSASLLAYATTKGAIANFTNGLAEMIAERGIRVNAVAPGPIWTPFIPSTLGEDHVANFGANTPLGRPGQPAELAATYVLLACDESSYTTGALYEVTGGKSMI